jgi:hypothetical protein
MVSPVSTAAFLTCLAAQCSGPSVSALDIAHGNSSATASIAHIFFIIVLNIYKFDVLATEVIRCLDETGITPLFHKSAPL